MPKAQKSAAAKATESKPKRKMLTPAERIEKAKADLAALEQKAADKARESISKIETALATAKEQQTKANAKVEKLEAELAEAKATAGEDVDPETSES